jgi:hypothetical protein
MKFSDLNAQDALSLGELAVDVLAFIARMTGHTEAPAFLAIVRAVLQALDSYRGGLLTADDVRQTMAHFEAAIAKNDAAADQALRDKFPGEKP